MAKRLCAGGLDAHWSRSAPRKYLCSRGRVTITRPVRDFLASHWKDVGIGEVRTVARPVTRCTLSLMADAIVHISRLKKEMVERCTLRGWFSSHFVASSVLT